MGVTTQVRWCIHVLLLETSGLFMPSWQRSTVLIYSGDADGCVPHTGTEEWTYELGFDVAEPWRPWRNAPNTANGEVSGSSVVGYVTKFGGDALEFSFATVMGAGHEVPTFRPEAAFTMISRFRQGVPLVSNEGEDRHQHAIRV